MACRRCAALLSSPPMTLLSSAHMSLNSVRLGRLALSSSPTLIQPLRMAFTRYAIFLASHLDGIKRRLGSGVLSSGWMWSPGVSIISCSSPQNTRANQHCTRIVALICHEPTGAAPYIVRVEVGVGELALLHPAQHLHLLLRDQDLLLVLLVPHAAPTTTNQPPTNQPVVQCDANTSTRCNQSRGAYHWLPSS